MRKSKRTIALLLILGLGLLAAVILYWPRTMSLEATGESATRAIQERDGATIFALLTSEEKAAYNLTLRTVQNFLDQYAASRIPFGAIRETEFHEINPGQGLFTTRMTGANGKDIALGVVVTEYRGRTACVSLILSVLMASWEGYQVGALPGNKSIAKLKLWLEAARRDQALLQSLGIHGVYRNETEGLLTWDKWKEHCQKVIALAEKEKL